MNWQNQTLSEAWNKAVLRFCEKCGRDCNFNQEQRFQLVDFSKKKPCNSFKAKK